jgi:hypothetical protein
MKTVEELAEEHLKAQESIPLMHYFPWEPCRKAFIAGYEAAKDQKFKDNVRATYNDHKLKEAEQTIAKLKERLKLLSLEFSRIMETTEEVRDLFDGWKKDDQVFEHHGKVGPWAGFFPVKKDDV